MKIFKDRKNLQREISSTKAISFVPTMGGLHKGHISLIKKSKKTKLKTLVSIFVNPKQFNEKKDFKSYPRNQKKDLKILKNLKVSGQEVLVDENSTSKYYNDILLKYYKRIIYDIDPISHLKSIKNKVEIKNLVREELKNQILIKKLVLNYVRSILLQLLT